MSRRVYGWDQNPAVDRFVYRCSNSSAEMAIVDGFAIAVTDGDGRKSIQLREPTEVEDVSSETSVGMVVSAKTVLMFIRTHCHGTPLHYEIPRAGDRGMRRHGLFYREKQLKSRVIRVSHRNLFSR